MWKWVPKAVQQLMAPAKLFAFAGRIAPSLLITSVSLLSIGLFWGVFLAPPDYQQSDAFRIIYLHVPAAFMSLAVYTTMAIAAFLGLVWQTKAAFAVMRASVPLGSVFTFLALVTGAIWGKPMWGTWWIWDARLTSELILLFIYLGIWGLQNAIADPIKSAKAAAFVVLIGVIDLPIIHYSVYWWNTLHQGATLSRFARPSMSADMLYPLLFMIAGLYVFYFALLAIRVRTEILMFEHRSKWVGNFLERQS